VSNTDFQPDAQQPSSTAFARLNTYKITIVRAMDGNHLFAPGDEAAQFSVPSVTSVNVAAQNPTGWTSANVITPGQSYTAQGYVSIATASQLSAVPYPTAADPGTYPPNILQQYLFSTNPDTIPADVAATAQRVTQGSTSMYDAAVMLENYLRNFKYSLTNPAPPAGEDAISFFLQQQQGFCTHFATAMAIMGRALGMPTRVALGFSSGHFDDKSHTYVVKGTEAHVWPQVYFAQYGWVNFEPTSSFNKFTRATSPSIGGGSTATVTGTIGTQGTPTRPTGRDRGSDQGGTQSPITSPAGTALIDVGLGLSLFIVVVLLLLVLIGLWWRIIYRGLPPVSAAFARVATLGRWAGAAPRRSQTPLEYADTLSGVVPGQRTNLRRLSEIYSRERWGGGASRDALGELPRLYDQMRLAISRVIVRRLRSAPMAALTRGRSRLRRGRSRKNDRW
jgi:transglutaminase-like putative cysteine protease